MQGTFLCNLGMGRLLYRRDPRGIPNARLILLAFLPDCTTLFLRPATVAGFISPEWSAGTAQIWDSLGVLLLLSFVIGGRSASWSSSRSVRSRRCWRARQPGRNSNRR